MNKYFKIIVAALVLTVSASHAGLPPTRSSGSNDPTLRTTFDFLFPNMTISRAGVKSSISTPQDIFTTSNVTFNNEIIAGHLTLTNPSYDGVDVGNALLVDSSTGILTGGNLSINAGNNTTFDISAGFGVIIDTTTPATPTLKRVFFGPFTAQTVTNLATSDFTYVYINNDGTIFQSTALPDPATRRSKIFLGRLNHQNRLNLLFTDTIPDFNYNVGSGVFDLFDALGPFNISGNVITPNGANLLLNKSAGQMFQRSSNYTVTNQNPHVKTTPALTGLTFAYQNQTGASISLQTAVDPTNYDVGGVTTLIPGSGSVSTVQRVYLFNSNNVRIQRGQFTYPTLAQALQNFEQEAFIVNPTIQGFAVLIAYIAVQKNCVNLNSSCATILAAPKFQSGSVSSVTGGTTSLQQAYQNSLSPQIVLNSTQGGLSFTDNATPLGTSLFKLSNSALTTNYIDVSANGIDTSGGFANSTLIKSANYTLTAADHTIIGSTAGIVLTLPAPVARREYIVKNSATGPIKVSGNIEGVTTGTYTIQTLQGVRFQSDGLTWYANPMESNGSSNLLSNPGFENNGNGWTTTNATASVESTIIAQGGLSHKLTLTAQTGDLLTQSITPIIQTLGQNMQASCRVNTTLSTIQLCALNAGSEFSCQSVPATGTFSNVIVNFPGVSSGTLGVKVKATSSSTGTVYVDDCFLGYAQNIGSVSQASIVGDLKFAQTASCSWPITQTTYAADFAANASCPTATVTGSITSPSKTPQMSYANAPPGDYEVMFLINLFQSATTDAKCQIIDDLGNSLVDLGITLTAGNISIPMTLTGKQTYTTSGNRTWKVQCQSTSGSITILASPPRGGGLTGIVKYFSTSSQQAVNASQQNYDWTPYTPTFTGFGTPTAIEFQQKREGSDLLIRGKFLSGVATAVEARISLPPGLTSADTTKIPSLQQAGAAGALNVGTNAQVIFLIEPSVNYLTISIQTNTTSGQTKATGSALFGSGQGTTVQARVPIQGWIQTNSAPLLVGSVTSSSLGSERMERAFITGGGFAACTTTPCTIISQSGNWLSSVSRTTTGTYTLNFIAGEFSGTPICVCSTDNATGAPTCKTNRNVTSSSSAMGIVLVNTADTFADGIFNVMCMGPK